MTKEVDLLSEINNSLIKIALILSEQDKKRNDFNSKFIGEEINTKESLTSQEHYTVADLVKTFIREKPELIATAKEVDDDDAPDFPTVDAHDDIIDIEDKLESAESVVETTEKTTALDKNDDRNDEFKKAVVEEVEKTETKGTE